ncbi:MAG: DUF2911 domain-containing protein, partial [Acidobacteriota bacterium]|nr:DUF2911 domain-containing protein [Acidobacteriota bacterium]
YHRPNVKARTIWGDVVPYGEVWRTGANENTTFEVSSDVKINGQVLPKGKYGLHTIPSKDEWTIIFNKVNNEWGSFKYNAKEDALRVMVKPITGDFKETMTIDFENLADNTAQIVIAWEKLRVPFTLDVGDVNMRVLTDFRRQIIGDPVQAANFVLNSKLTANYEEALSWLNNSIKMNENYANLNTKARLLAEMGRKDEAITTAEKAIQVGKATNPPANTAGLETLVKEWKAKK